MMRLLVVFHLLGPAFLGYAIAYWLVYPQDWSGPAIVAPIGLLLTIAAQALSLRALQQTTDAQQRLIFIATQIAGPIGGLLIGVMVYLLLIGVL